MTINPHRWPRRRILGLALVVLTAAVAIAVFRGVTFRTDRHMYTHRAISDARFLVQGCQAYRSSPRTNGRYPPTLTDLLAPPANVGPFVDMARGLEDPWGNTYRYALVRDEQGAEVPYVWTERPADRGVVLIGARGTSDGDTVMFGLPP